MKYYSITPLALPFDKYPTTVRPELPKAIRDLHESVFGVPQEEIVLCDRPDMPSALRAFAIANGIKIT